MALGWHNRPVRLGSGVGESRPDILNLSLPEADPKLMFNPNTAPHIGFYTDETDETGRLIASSINATMPRDAL